MRIISFDTETTGFCRVAGKQVCDGHRVVELACVELSDEENPLHFHTYFNPKRAVDEGAFSVHGLSNEFLLDKPGFHEKVDVFLEFIKGATLIAHNASFDLAFLNQELSLIGYNNLQTYCHEVIDTLAIARKKYPGKKNSLDALCQRLEIDLSGRKFHGALKDSLLLLKVYRKMTGGQVELELSTDVARSILISDSIKIVKLFISEEEEQSHVDFIKTYC
ncbi:DNA polymerase III subunit epsilon [bacterium]|nr:DNA polymerase III subunit epsilon [bacterium]NBW56380.1 DNA polymerase III subunit epsilon [bacterium]NBX72007.1 DNA polymerase III subunit epsilon [bacterium]